MNYILILLKSVSQASQLLKRKDSMIRHVWDSYPPVRDSQYTRYKAFGNSYWKKLISSTQAFQTNLSTDISFF